LAVRTVLSDEGNALKLTSLSTYGMSEWLLGINLTFEKAEGSRDWTYAAGIKRKIRHHLGLGAEIAGGLEELRGEVVGGVFYEVKHGLQVNAGLGTGFSNDQDLTLKTALVWVFK